MATVQELLDEISALLASPATLENPDFELVAFGAHDPEHGAPQELDPVRMRSILGRRSTPETRAWFESYGIATATEPVRTPADPELGIAPRLCLPVRHAGRLLGYLWLLDDGHLDDGHLDDGHLDGGHVDGAAPAIREAVRLVAVLAEEMVSGDAEAQLAAAITGTGVSSGAGSLALTEHLPARIVVGPMRGAALISTEVDGRLVSLVPPRAAVQPGSGAGGTGGSVGVGSLALTLAEISVSYRDAAFAAVVAAAIPGAGPVARWDDLGAYRLLRDVRAADPVLDALADSPELLETLELYLDRAGNVAHAAEALHIHRQTLYYRLSRIETLTGCDLGDGEVRLLLHMSVKLARLGR